MANLEAELQEVKRLIAAGTQGGGGGGGGGGRSLKLGKVRGGENVRALSVEF